ncbi:DDB1- and CUL4-associated factor 5 [Psilocybe cubensis]|uniref:DDB1- and CUL4-associated factor 5 n=1 Tax=Psilocybe cubensis TaxID=181762 RepID=A0ACB8H0A3_PSICU|nr:DDB1- and CUL4-associated factor 5 [Psilocybe cubensis]KAH9480635.1 DDB1- and CUL4-associated factor 5 [Psilocybe cubensis]
MLLLKSERAISEDGTIRRYDWRQGGAPPSSQDIIQTENEVTDVKFHPTMEHLFADSDGSGRVFLRDSRMAFGSLPKRSNEGIVRRYNTKLTKKTYSHLSHPEASSITFDKDGSCLLVFLSLAYFFLLSVELTVFEWQHYLPTIFSVSDPNPLAVLSGKNLPDGTPVPSNQTTYSNSCTMKHGSFGGPGLDNDDMYAAGSDDFYCYIWRIPPLPQLMDQREIYTEKRWSVYGDASTIAFTEGRHEPKIAPVELSTPLDRLTGHNSIVNTTLFHPHFLHIVTAGVENSILLHSPTPSSPCTQNLQRSPENVRVLKDEDAEEDRRLYYRTLLGAHSPHAEDNEAIERNERRTLRIIIREEGQVDCFETRPWRSDGEDSSDEDNDEEDEDDDSDTLLLDISGEEVFPRIRMFLN